MRFLARYIVYVPDNISVNGLVDFSVNIHLKKSINFDFSFLYLNKAVETKTLVDCFMQSTKGGSPFVVILI